MRTKFDIGEKVYVKNGAYDSDIDVFTVKSIIVDDEGIKYRLKYVSGWCLTITEDQIESVVQK